LLLRSIDRMNLDELKRLKISIHKYIGRFYGNNRELLIEKNRRIAELIKQLNPPTNNTNQESKKKEKTIEKPTQTKRIKKIFLIIVH